MEGVRVPREWISRIPYPTIREGVRTAITIYMAELAAGTPPDCMELQVQIAGQNTMLRVPSPGNFWFQRAPNRID